MAVLASLPLVAVAISAVISEMRDLRDPCLHWAESSGWGSPISCSCSEQPADPCATHTSGTSETRAGSIIRTLVFPGGILAAVTLGILGAVRSRYNPVFLVGWSMFLVIPVIFTAAPLAILAGAGFLWVANQLQPDSAAA